MRVEKLVGAVFGRQHVVRVGLQSQSCYSLGVDSAFCFMSFTSSLLPKFLPFSHPTSLIPPQLFNMFNNHLGRLGGRGIQDSIYNANRLSGRPNPSQGYPQKHPYGIDRDILIKDLKNERPQWIFSSYGPGRDAPIQLFGGPQREQSFEEMRLRHYIAAAQGHPQSAIQEANAFYMEAEKQIQAVLNDPEGAIQYIVKGENEHPNRHDILKQGPQPTSFVQGPMPVQPSNTLNPTPNPFAAAAAAAAGGIGGFGEPNSGQPSLGQQNPLGQRVNPFGATAPIPNFENTSAAPGSQPQPQPQLTGGMFGQPSQPTVPKPAQPNPNPFLNPFANPPTPLSSNPFATPPTQPAPTGATQQPSQPQQPAQPQAFTNPNQLPQATQGETHHDARGVLTMWHGRPVTYITPPMPPSAPGGEQPSALPPYPCYKRDDGLLERINFPNGRRLGNTPNAVPGSAAAQGQMGEVDMSGVEGRPEEYTGAVKEAYEYLAKNGMFKDGIMPHVPPKREWVNWDF